ncbi:MAG: outer membrane protein assembly factor BamD [Hydromonas sp.]|nr:outer membrane protein assembly factor BamD [Hydromonas sp.]MBP6295286.1 outer membrane protein assembly factor BamD [Hydromonas sp.]
MLMAVGFSLLVGCASKEKNEFAGWSVDKLYTEGRDQMNAGDYTRSALLLEATIAQYPFSVQATQAQLELPYVYWKDESRLKALAAADRFITLNGSHPQLDYMYYLKGIINYNNNTGFIKTLLTRDVGSNASDPRAATEAFNAFKTLVTKFPESRYAPDARKRMVQLVNTLSQQQLRIAEYYYDRGAYLAAINRAQGILKNFDGTISTENALIIMMQSYDKLGMNDLRDDTRKVLLTNFPNSKGVLDVRATSKQLAKTQEKVDLPKPQ